MSHLPSSHKQTVLRRYFWCGSLRMLLAIQEYYVLSLVEMRDMYEFFIVLTFGIM